MFVEEQWISYPELRSSDLLMICNVLRLPVSTVQSVTFVSSSTAAGGTSPQPAGVYCAISDICFQLHIRWRNLAPACWCLLGLQ